MLVAKSQRGSNRAMASLAVLVALLAVMPTRALWADDQVDPQETEAMRRMLEQRMRGQGDKSQAKRAGEPLPPMELRLSGNEVGVQVLESGAIVITGNEADLEVLESFAQLLDWEPPEKQIVLHTLKNVGADQVAQKLEAVLAEIWPGSQNIPDQRVSVVAVSSNVLLIAAPDSRLKRILDIAKTIDEVAEVIPEFTSMKFYIKYRKAAEVAEQLTDIIAKLQAKQEAKANEEITLNVNDADNSIMVFGPETLRDRIQRLIDQIDVEPVEGHGHLKLVMFPLMNTTAEDLAGVLTEMLASTQGQSDIQETIRRLSVIRREADGTLTQLKALDLDKPLRIIADKATESLLIATVEENIEALGEVIKLLDSFPTGHELAMKIFPLKFADAGAVEELLKQMFDEGKKLPERAPGGIKTEAVPRSSLGEALVYNIATVVDKRTNTLIVSGREEQLAVAQVVVSQIDVPVTVVHFPLRLMFLGDQIDATRVAAIVKDLFEKRAELMADTEAGKLATARQTVFVAVDVRSNALIVSASDESYEEIAGIVEELNSASQRLAENIRIINCKNTNAADLASKINDLWQRKASLRRESELPEDLPVIVPDQRSNSLVLAASPEDYEEIKRLVETLESQPLSPIAEIRLVTLQHNDASQTSDMLKTLFEERMAQRLASGQEANPSDRVAVAVDASTNTMLVASSRENFDEMLRIIEGIDVEPIIEGVVRVFILKHAEAANVVDKVKELFDQGLYNPSGGVEGSVAEQRQKVALIADARTNAIVASASKPNLSIIERLIENMDTGLASVLDEDTKIIPLQYADALKLSVMMDALFEGRKAESPEPDLFRKPTIIADERSNTLIISGGRDALQRAEMLVADLDRPSGEPTFGFEVYSLKYTSAVRLAGKMQELFDKRAEGREGADAPINIQADEASNSLIASASRDDHLLIVGLLDLLDKPSNIAKQFQIFPLQMARAETVAETLDQLFQQQAEGAGGRADVIAVQPDLRSNSLVVWAAASEMENVQTIINKLDTAKPAVEMMMKVIQLKQALAEDFAEMLLNTLTGGDGQGDDQRAVILSWTETLDDGTRVVRKLLRQDITITPEPRTNSLMVMAPVASIDMLEALIRDIDRIKPATAEIRIFPLVNSDADEIVQRLTEIFGLDDQQGGGAQTAVTFGADGAAIPGAVTGGAEGGGIMQRLRFTAYRRTNSVIASGNVIDLQMAEQLIRELDATDLEERNTVVYKPRFLGADSIGTMLTSLSDAENQVFSELDDQVSVRRRAERQVSVVSDEDSNTVLIGASPAYQQEYMDLVRKMDRPEPQVMISVLIAEVSLDDRMEFGIEFAAQDLNFSEKAVSGLNNTIKGSGFDIVAGTDIGAAGVGFGGLSITVSGEDFSFLFRALKSEGQVEVLSRPTILVQNNATGNITIGDRVPIVTGQSTAGGQSSATVQLEDVGIILDVTPHINPDGYVTLEINPEISTISGQSVQISEGLSAVVISERSAETTVTIKDGETVILGGLITETTDRGETKVPWLGDLPILGNLFKSQSSVSSKTELLIVLTVNVLRDEHELLTKSLEEVELTGRLPSRIRRSPLMEGLRIRAGDGAFGPIEDRDEMVPMEEKVPAQPQPGVYGPTPNRYGPVRPAATTSSVQSNTAQSIDTASYRPRSRREP